MKKIFGSKSQTNVYIQCANEAWEWDYSKKSTAVQITSNNLSASRPTADGNNPAILSTRPLNKYNPHFRIQVETIGTWVGIGVVDTNFTLNGGAIIGNQKDCVNSSYFYQNSASLKLEAETEKNVDTKIEAGNIIDVYVDFDNDKILYWNNSEFLGYMSSSKIKQNKLFACANLSSNTKVAFLNRDAPQLPLPKDLKPKNHDNDVLMKPAYNYSITWKWSTSLKASSVVLSGGNEVASRPSTEGSNPAILAGLPLSSTHNHFRVQIQSIGKWIGIGFSDEKYQLNDGSTLGSQKECINCGYFQQDRSTLNLNDKERFDVGFPIMANDIIDVLVDFNTNKVYFWNNSRFVGVISHSSVVFQENKIYPCVNLSSTTVVTLLQNSPMPIIPSEAQQSQVKTTVNTTPAPYQPVQPAPKPESPVPAKLNNSMQNLNLSDNSNKEPLILLVEHESLKYPVKFAGNTLEELHEHIFKIVKPQRAFKVAYWSTDFEENLVLTDIRDLQNKMKLTLILTDQRPADVSSSSFSLVGLDKSAKEFDEVEMQFRADFQNHHEYYVAQRVKNNKLPITFVLMNAWKVVNPELENKFAYFYEKLKTLGRNAEELKVRRAYHGTRASNVEPICKNGLLKIGNPKNPSQATDPGWFGDPRKGVYVSRHVEYTTKYSNSLAHLEPNDRVKIIMFKTLPGKSFHVEQVTKGMSPTPGYDSHSSPSFLEWFLFDEAQSCPVYVLEVQALENTRVKSDDGSKH